MTLLDETPDKGAATESARRESPVVETAAEAEAESHRTGAEVADEGPPREPIGAAASSVAANRKPLTRAPDWLSTHISSVVVGLILVALASALVVTTLQLRHRNAVDSARTSALSAAKVYAVELASYNYHSLDQDFGKVLADSTPTFRQSFSQSSDALKSVLTKYDATAKATVVAAGMVSASTSRSVALIFLNQTVTNTTQKGAGTTDQSRLEITMLHSGGRWLINQVTLL